MRSKPSSEREGAGDESQANVTAVLGSGICLHLSSNFTLHHLYLDLRTSFETIHETVRRCIVTGQYGQVTSCHFAYCTTTVRVASAISRTPLLQASKSAQLRQLTDTLEDMLQPVRAVRMDHRLLLIRTSCTESLEVRCVPCSGP